MRANVEQYVDLRVPAYGRQAVSRFRVLVWWKHPLTAAHAGAVAPPLVVMSDAPSSVGPSITNAAEVAWAWAQKHYPGALVIEHYAGSLHLPDRFAIIEVYGDRASWSPVGPELEALITRASR